MLLRFSEKKYWLEFMINEGFKLIDTVYFIYVALLI